MLAAVVLVLLALPRIYHGVVGVEAKCSNQEALQQALLEFAHGPYAGLMTALAGISVVVGLALGAVRFKRAVLILVLVLFLGRGLCNESVIEAVLIGDTSECTKCRAAIGPRNDSKNDHSYFPNP